MPFMIFNGDSVNWVPLHTVGFRLVVMVIAGVGFIFTTTVKVEPVHPNEDVGVTV